MTVRATTVLTSDHVPTVINQAISLVTAGVSLSEPLRAAKAALTELHQSCFFTRR
ncbi:hypothetical protein [Halocatena pleomorpha]|uniref:hypothetical protein n=1 Tax=Halocatena pleomorpha TaxID=1785090 RepID=UPI001639FD95|nr:hypothetical protein [Halocatena pleomorpha]